MTKKIYVSKLPFAISIEPANYCQLSCPECPVGLKNSNQKKGELSIKLFKKIINEVYKKTFYLNLYFQGEPLLNKQLPLMISYAKKCRMFTVVSTNAQLLDKKMAIALANSKLSKIIISMDGFTQETYSKYRIGGDIEKVKKAIDYLIKAKSKNTYPKICVQFIVNKYNEKEISEFLKWAKQKKVKAILKTMQIYKDFSFLPVNEKYRRYKKVNDEWKIKNQGKGCFRIWSQCVIRYNGDVLPCCFDKKGEYVLGNIDKTQMHEIWNSQHFNEFRLKVLKSKKNIPICSNCTE